MKESLSALIDDELVPEAEFGVLIARVADDAALRRAWDTYHLIGDALRDHLGPEVAGAVGRRLREEPTVLAPRASRRGAGRLAWYAMSAAASVAAVALVAWTALPLIRPQLPVAAGTAANAPIVPVAASAPASEPKPRPATAEVENYLLAHQPYSHTSAMQGIAPYVRALAEGRDDGAR